ncbi:phosphoglycerate dehydrogenase [Paraliomyxa miuraensis]|uniref:phosphoglycerate dehydrogenase n=1 Tax=Paraliomyxa miuraensis TaxID=376150 RepID=UPI00224C8772|nr:phosphoglycerate dehydrogenase [Paraliomyxa miuraensis]MCX4247799.1 phosphoglycerate dehydrogenase [Paraliomyxa miuraensis]
MPRAHALLLENLHATASEVLATYDVETRRLSTALSEDELVSALQDFPGDGPVFVGIRSKTHVTPRVFDAVPRLVAIGAFCIGTDQIALDVARRSGVAVFNAPFSSTRSVAELVIAEVVMLSRQVFARSKAAHEGHWDKSATGAHEVRGKTLGIIGYGHIGSQASILAEALGMQVQFYDIDKKLPLGNANVVDSLEALLGSSDFVSLHVPDTELTRGMIGREQLCAMRRGAYLLNLSRGKVVDIPALRDALVSGHLAGAAVDVYPREPANTKEVFESELRGLDNVILTPHIGGSTQEAQANIGREVAHALGHYLDHGSTLGCVTLPSLDLPVPTSVRRGPASRIVNVHQNVPGVLSAINRVVAETNVNIVGQALATVEDVGLLFIDVPLAADDPRAEKLREGISALDTSVRTRLLWL